MNRQAVWDWVAARIVQQPGRVLAISLVPILLPILAVPFLRPTHDLLASLPATADSVRGLEALNAHMPPGETAPVVVVVDGEIDVFQPAAFRALGDLSRNLKRLPGVATVRSVAMPTDGRRPDLDDETAAEFSQLTDRLGEAASGASAIAGGIARLEAGLAEMDRRLPELTGGLAAAREGTDALLAGVGQLVDGVTALRGGLSQLDAGLAEAHDGTTRLRDEVARPTEAALDRAMQALAGFTVGRADPMYGEAYEAAGEAYARVHGRYPVGHPQAGEQVDPEYEGLSSALGQLAEGLADARAGVTQLDAGLVQLGDGGREIAAGLRQLREGLARAEAGAGELHAGIAEMHTAVRDELLPGARRLAEGLAQGADRLERSGVTELVSGGDEGPFVLTAALVDALPDLREQLGFFVTDDARRTRVFVGLASRPFSDEAIATVDRIREAAALSLSQSPLEDAEVVVTGPAAFINEVDAAARRDFPVIVVAVTLGVLAVLIVLLRSLVAPLFMICTVLLSYGAALGLTTIVYQGLLGEAGIQWWIPPLLFVLLVALGVDYSIFLMGRVREEAQRRLTRDAVGEAVRHTGDVITSAGVILAGTFGAMMIAPLRSLAQLGFAAMAGILLDTFIVRALLVPSVAVLLGRWNWWPSARTWAD